MKFAVGALAFIALCSSAAAYAESRQEQAARVISKAGGPSKACDLLTNADVVNITGRRSYVAPQGTTLTNGGSACDFDSANVTLFSGPKSQEHYDALLKNFKKDRTPRQPVAGVGERAYLLVPEPRDKYEGRYAILVVHQGEHTLAVALEAQDNEAPQSLQPKLMTMVKTALPRLP
jgi:hypothetical protein